MGTIAELVTSPLYNYAEAEHLARVPRGTAKRWLRGYRYALGELQVSRPPVTPGREDAGAVTFTDLIELIVIGRLKELRFSLPQIRRIVQNCQAILGVPHPLSSLRFKTGGMEFFVDQGDTLIEVGRRRGQQAWNDVLAPFLQELEYAGDLAHRWWPLGREGGVMVDPDYGFGLPVVADAGVRTEIIAEQFQAGQPIARIAEWFNLTSEKVEQAVRFESQRAA
jgi:uncharacterized protein (DUF433 family)